MDHEKMYDSWKDQSKIIKFYAYIPILIIGLIYPPMFFLFSAFEGHYVSWEIFYGRSSMSLVFYVLWIFIILLISFTGYVDIKRANFYKGKIAKTFSRKKFEKDPSLLIDYYQTLYDFRSALIENKIRYSINTHYIVFKRKVSEFQILDNQLSVFIEPMHYNEERHFHGAIISIGPNAIKNNPDVFKIISLIERTFSPNKIY